MHLLVNQLEISASLKGKLKNNIVSNVSFRVEEGEKLAIVGQSGCGKTMIAMAILGLLPDNCTASGNVLWGTHNLLNMDTKSHQKLLGRKHVYIPQSGADFLNPSLTIRRQMKESLSRNGIKRKHHNQVMKALLENVGFHDIEQLLNAYPFQLSGGMAQRVVMAMASVGTPNLVIADEPTKGIDQANTALFLNHLHVMFSNAAVLLITHDMSVASACDQILVLREGKVEEYGNTTQVLTNPKSSYTKQLILDLPNVHEM